jgi:hypothetical protein
MAISPFKTFSAGEVLTASDLNSSFTQITNNGEDLGWPATKSKDLDGNELVLDADGDTSIHASTDDQIDFKIGGSDIVVMTAPMVTFTSDITMSTDDSTLTLKGSVADVIITTDAGGVSFGTGNNQPVNIVSNGADRISIAVGGAITIPNDFTVSGGNEVFLNLPVSAGTAGSLWNDSGTVKVA